MNEGAVFPRDCSRLQVLHQLGVGRQRFRHHHDSRSVLVQPLHDAGPRRLRQLGTVMQQGVDQGAVGVARAGVNHQARGLVDNDEMLVFMDDVQREGLAGPVLVPVFQQGVDLDDRAGAHGVFLRQGRAIDRDEAGLYPALQARAGMLRTQQSQRLVQPFAAMPLRHSHTQCLAFHIHNLAVSRAGRPWFQARRQPANGPR